MQNISYKLEYRKKEENTIVDILTKAADNTEKSVE